MGRARAIASEVVKQVFAVAPRPPKVTGGGKVPRYPQMNVGGAITALGAASPRWGGGYTLDRGLRDAYDVMEVVRAVVDTLGEHCGSVPWRVSQFSSQEARAWYEWELKTTPAPERSVMTRDWKMTNGSTTDTKQTHQLEPLPRHDLEKIIEQPNEFMERKLVMTTQIMHLMMAGNSLLVKMRKPLNPKRVFELFPLIPVGVGPVKDDDNIITGYAQRVPGANQEITYDYHDVLHAMLPNMQNLYWGSPVMQSAMRSVLTDNEATDWNKVTFQNRGRPDIGIAFKEKGGWDQYEETRAILRAQFTGLENARTPYFAFNDPTFSSLSMSAAELDFIESRKMTARWICIAFRVDPRIIGLADGADGDAHRQHWATRILPILDGYQGLFQKELAPEFGEDLLPWYDTSGVYAFADDVHRRVQSQKILNTQGWPNDVLNRRFSLGLPEGVEGMDMSMWPASAISSEEIELRKEKLEVEIELLRKKLEADEEAPEEETPGEGDEPPEDNEPDEDEDDEDQPDPDDEQTDPDQPSLPNAASRRWYEVECEMWLQEQDIPYEPTPHKTNNFFVYDLERNSPNWMRAKVPDGSSIRHDANEGTLKAYFYHGEKHDLDKLKQMGFDRPGVNGNRG